MAAVSNEADVYPRNLPDRADLDGSIGERKFKVFNDFDIQPVFTNAQPGQALILQYLENKKLYFLKKVNGNVVAVY